MPEVIKFIRSVCHGQEYPESETQVVTGWLNGCSVI